MILANAESANVALKQQIDMQSAQLAELAQTAKAQTAAYNALMAQNQRMSELLDRVLRQLLPAGSSIGAASADVSASAMSLL